MKTFFKYAVLVLVLAATAGAILSAPTLLRIQAKHKHTEQAYVETSRVVDGEGTTKAVSKHASINFSQSDIEKVKLPQQKNKLKEQLEKEISEDEGNNGYFSVVTSTSGQTQSSAPALTKAEKKRIEDKRDREETWAYSNAEDYIDETQKDMLAGDKVEDLEPEEETVETIILGDKKNVKAYQYILGETTPKVDDKLSASQGDVSNSATDEKVAKVVETQTTTKSLFETDNKVLGKVNFNENSIFSTPNALSSAPAIANYSIFGMGNEKSSQKQLEAFNVGKQQRMADFNSFFAISPTSVRGKESVVASDSSQGSIFDMGSARGADIPYRLPSSAVGNDSLFRSPVVNSPATMDIREERAPSLNNRSVRPIQRLEIRR